MKTLIQIFLICISSQSFADYINNGDMQFYGKIIFVDNLQIILKESCTGENKKFLWRENITAQFTEQCNHPGWEMSISPILAEQQCLKKKVFVFGLKNGKESYADSFFYKDNTLQITYAKGKGNKTTSTAQLHTQIEWVIYRTYCEKDIPNDFSTL